MTNGPIVEVPRFLRFSPWTLTPFVAAVLAVGVELIDGWNFLNAVHPAVLGGVAVGLAIWLLYALVPKLTVHLMDILDLHLPTGESAIPLVGRAIRFVTVLLGPALIYLSLMALREEAARGWKITAAAVLGLVLGAIGWRSVTLINIWRNNYPEDEIRKGILRTGAYPQAAKEKLREVFYTIADDDNLDRKRMRLRRLELATRALRNINYDPQQDQLRTRTAATAAGFERERDLYRARRNADLEDIEFETKISEQRAKQRHFDGLNQSRRARHGQSVEEELDNELSDDLNYDEAGDRIRKRRRRKMKEEGLGKEEINRRMARIEAKLAEIIARKMSGE